MVRLGLFNVRKPKLFSPHLKQIRVLYYFPLKNNVDFNVPLFDLMVHELVLCPLLMHVQFYLVYYPLKQPVQALRTVL